MLKKRETLQKTSYQYQFSVRKYSSGHYLFTTCHCLPKIAPAEFGNFLMTHRGTEAQVGQKSYTYNRFIRHKGVSLVLLYMTKELTLTYHFRSTKLYKKLSKIRLVYFQ